MLQTKYRDIPTILPRCAHHGVFDFPVLGEEVCECAMGDDQDLFH